jgi:hypothetical protein
MTVLTGPSVRHFHGLISGCLAFQKCLHNNFVGLQEKTLTNEKRTGATERTKERYLEIAADS